MAAPLVNIWFSMITREPKIGILPKPTNILYITPLLMERFPLNLNDIFTSTRGCAEPMCQLKVKVTVKCQILNKQILDIMSCPLYKPYTNGRISFKLEWHFHLNWGCAEPMLPMCQLKVKVTVKCQILNKQILDIMSCPLHKSYTNGRISLDLQSPCWPCVSSRSRSQLKVKY